MSKVIGSCIIYIDATVARPVVAGARITTGPRLTEMTQNIGGDRIQAVAMGLEYEADTFEEARAGVIRSICHFPWLVNMLPTEDRVACLRAKSDLMAEAMPKETPL